MQQIEKLATGIEGFDFIASGGIPAGRTTLIAGSAGSAKTVFAAQFLAEGIAQFHQPGVFVTFEESPDDIRCNMASMGWDIAEWERAGLWRFVDASPQAGDEMVIIGSYDLGALLARIEGAVREIGGKRLAMDSLGAVFHQFTDVQTVRAELFRVSAVIKKLRVTAIMTAERTEEYGEIARFGIEEFVADNVILLRNILEEEKRRRTIEILKFRGTHHHKGEFPFTIKSGEGVVVIPLSSIELKQHSSDVRITSGNTKLDEMCGGGFYRDSIVLVSGSTGTGKTLMTSEFIAGGLRRGERCLLVAFEESREQLFRNASGWGMDFDKYEQSGQLCVVCEYPETAGLEDHLLRIKNLITEFAPNRIAVDSLSALERVASLKSFREFVIGLTSFIKHQELAGLFTSTTPSLMGGQSITEAHISTITDSIILLRYVETFGEMRRGLTVLKMRGSMHDKNIREFRIDAGGMHIGEPFRSVQGIISGNTRQVQTEIDPLSHMFREDQ